MPCFHLAARSGRQSITPPNGIDCRTPRCSVLVQPGTVQPSTYRWCCINVSFMTQRHITWTCEGDTCLGRSFSNSVYCEILSTSMVVSSTNGHLKKPTSKIPWPMAAAEVPHLGAPSFEAENLFFAVHGGHSFHHGTHRHFGAWRQRPPLQARSRWRWDPWQEAVGRSTSRKVLKLFQFKLNIKGTRHGTSQTNYHNWQMYEFEANV